MKRLVFLSLLLLSVGLNAQHVINGRIQIKSGQLQNSVSWGNNKINFQFNPDSTFQISNTNNEYLLNFNLKKVNTVIKKLHVDSLFNFIDSLMYNSQSTPLLTDTVTWQNGSFDIGNQSMTFSLDDINPILFNKSDVVEIVNENDTYTTVISEIYIEPTTRIVKFPPGDYGKTNFTGYIKKEISTSKQIKNVNIQGNLNVSGSISVGQSKEAPSAQNVGAIRYRHEEDKSFCEMVMQTGVDTFQWVIIKQNTW